MYYQILINGIILGTVGHHHVRNMHLSLQVEEEPIIFASAVCEENESLYLISWFQHTVSATDIVEFKKVCEGVTPEPIKKYKMRSAASEN
jgi:hypothetical protein